MMARWISQLTRASNWWQIVDLPSNTILERYRSKFDNSLPRFLVQGDTRIAFQNLLAAYPTVKRKCYDAESEFCHLGLQTTQQKYMHTCRTQLPLVSGTSSPLQIAWQASIPRCLACHQIYDRPALQSLDCTRSIAVRQCDA